jgi:enolase
VLINDNIIRACSEAILYSYGQTVNPASPYQGLYRYLRNRDITSGLPKFMFNVLNGGKALGSKVKFSKFYLILDVTPEDIEVDALEIYLKVQAQLKKQVQAHKLGENGFKGGALSIDGAFFNALENNVESYKFIEDAIAACQVNVIIFIVFTVID